MGVIFLKSESRQFISDCQSNIQNGQDVIQDLKSGCTHLMQAIDGKRLSGAAYTAGKGLFGELIVPVITRFGQAIEEMQADLRRYSSADQVIQAASTNKLDEDKLTQQIRECEAYRQTVKMTADALNSQAFEILAMSNPVTAMVALADQLFNIRGKLNAYLTSLDQDIDKLKNDLRLLQTFVSQTQGLFRDSSSRIKIAMQGISVLGKMTVNADGRYRFPKGMDERWFEEVINTEPSNEMLKNMAEQLGIPFNDFKYLYELQKKMGKRTDIKYFLDIMRLMKPGSLSKEKFLSFGGHGQKTLNYLMQDWRAIKKYLRTLDHPAATKLLARMDGSFNQFLKKIEKLKDFKGIAKYTKPLNKYVGWGTDYLKKGTLAASNKLSVLKPLGKLATRAGWVAMVASASYDGITAYNDKKSTAYHNVGKTAVHAGVKQLKSAGPIEGAIAGAAVGGPIAPITAGVGFAFGSLNLIWGALDPKRKDKFYSFVEKSGDWLVDKVADTGKSIGKASKGTWQSVTSFFGGGQQAYD